MNQRENFTKGLLKENQILVALLGLCPTLAITTSLENALGMGMAVIFCLTVTNLIISSIRKIVPDEIRIPIYIVVISTVVTIIDMAMAAFLPAIHKSLGIFIPLITVNCIILDRAEAFASKNGPLSSVVDALGMGIGYASVHIVISIIREVIGSGKITVWGSLVLDINKLFGSNETLPIFTNFFIQPAGAFIVLGLLLGIYSTIRTKRMKKTEVNKKWH